MCSCGGPWPRCWGVLGARASPAPRAPRAAHVALRANPMASKCPTGSSSAQCASHRSGKGSWRRSKAPGCRAGDSFGRPARRTRVLTSRLNPGGVVDTDSLQPKAVTEQAGPRTLRDRTLVHCRAPLHRAWPGVLHRPPTHLDAASGDVRRQRRNSHIFDLTRTTRPQRSTWKKKKMGGPDNLLRGLGVHVWVAVTGAGSPACRHVPAPC